MNVAPAPRPSYPFNPPTSEPPADPRYLNTEFCGHMYPAKTFDQEERVKQHALHHAHIHNQIGGMKSAGGIGWCAFDYNTHAVFGSGDRICYHGVMDIFRHPKFAAGFYASQQSPNQKLVLEPATYWKMGDKSAGGVEPLVIFSNANEIEVIIGKTSRGRFTPDRAAYPNLPHPPFIITNLGHTWGGDWQPLILIAFRNNRRVATRKMSNDGIPKKLLFQSDDPEIFADGSDMTRLSFRITDEFDNTLPFAMQPVTLTLTGPGALVGNNPHPLPGGRGTLYLRAPKNPAKSPSPPPPPASPAKPSPSNPSARAKKNRTQRKTSHKNAHSSQAPTPTQEPQNVAWAPRHVRPLTNIRSK